VVGDRVFVTETKDKKVEIVRALDRATGAELWQQTWDGAMKVPFFAARNGAWIRATPAWADGRLFIAGMREVLVALDDRDGRELWRIDFVEQFDSKMPEFGFVCSPLAVPASAAVPGGALYIEAANAVFSLDPATGAVRWRSAPLTDSDMMANGTFSSPILTEIAGRPHLLVQSRTHLVGLDPGDGAILWRQPIPSFRGMNILTPTVHNDTVFTSSYRNGSHLVRLAAQPDGSLEASSAWTHKASGYMSSPVRIGSVVYLHLGNGRFTAYDLDRAASGADDAQLWTSKPGFGDYASLVAHGDKILALADNGTLYLLQADPTAFTLLDEAEISDRATWAHLAVVGDELYVRELDGLMKLRWTSPAEAPAADAAASAAR
ncbi:MAG: PQQ-binding-like beta-propeller repeat protein, partial [Acidobacteriota bacterium]